VAKKTDASRVVATTPFLHELFGQEECLNYYETACADFD